MYKLKNVFWMKRDYPGMLLGQKSFFMNVQLLPSKWLTGSSTDYNQGRILMLSLKFDSTITGWLLMVGDYGGLKSERRK